MACGWWTPGKARFATLTDCASLCCRLAGWGGKNKTEGLQYQRAPYEPRKKPCFGKKPCLVIRDSCFVSRLRSYKKPDKCALSVRTAKISSPPLKVALQGSHQRRGQPQTGIARHTWGFIHSFVARRVEPPASRAVPGLLSFCPGGPRSVTLVLGLVQAQCRRALYKTMFPLHVPRRAHAPVH